MSTYPGQRRGHMHHNYSAPYSDWELVKSYALPVVADKYERCGRLLEAGAGVPPEIGNDMEGGE